MNEKQFEQEVVREQYLTPPAIDAPLVALFLGIYIWFVEVIGRRVAGRVPHLSPFEYGVIALGAFRLARIVAHEQVAAFLRQPFVERKLVHQMDGFETIEEVPRGSGIRRALGQLLTCSWCTGVWTAAALVYAWWLIPRLARPFTYVLAVAGGQFFLDVVTELVNKANLWLQREERLGGPRAHE